MKNIVITGSTRGIGYGLAEAFLRKGCAVAISGRRETSVRRVTTALANRYDRAQIFGQVCDVTDFDQVQRLWEAVQTEFGRIDIWINNAGLANPQLEFWQHPPRRMADVVQTNLLGTMYGSKVAITGLLAQNGGALYNMEGLGSNGRRVAGLTLYGSTKYGLRYLNEGLVDETRGTSVLVGTLSPGMVITDLLTSQYQDRTEDWESAKRIFNILADQVETVCPWLAGRVLANKKHGARITWLTRPKIMARFLLAPFRKRDLFA
jgi:NAD(P)-dependent dehydrogenase (short-subunit alcohol dehydrogenase family)